MAISKTTIEIASNGARMILVDVRQGTDEWFEWRKTGVTASDVPVILGLSPYKTPWQLWAEKVGKINPPDLSKNPNIRRGHRLEDEARQLAEERYDELLFPVCGEYVEFPVFKASFDGLCSVNEPYEFKAPCDSVFTEVEDSPSSDGEFMDVSENGASSPTYLMYESQVHAQCIVAGTTKGRLIFYKEDGSDVDFAVTLSDERKQEILERVDEFWKCVQTKKAPPHDPKRDWFIPEQGDDRFIWESTADAWLENYKRLTDLKEEQSSLVKDQRLLQQELTSRMGQYYHADVCGVKVTRFNKQGVIDYKGYLGKVFPDKDLSSELAAFRGDSIEQVRISRSGDELVNLDENEGVSLGNSGYF